MSGTSSVMFPFHIVKQIVIDKKGMNVADEDRKQSKSENPDHQIKYVDNNGFS